MSGFEYQITDQDADTVTVDATTDENEYLSVEVVEDGNASVVHLSPLQAEELAAALLLAARIARGFTLSEIAQ